MAQKLDGEAIVRPEITRGRDQTGGGNQKFVSLLQPDFSLGHSIRDVTGKDRRERVLIDAPLGRRHLGDVAELSAVTNDPAV